MGDPVQHHLRHSALAGIRLARGFVIDRSGQALQRTGTIDPAVIDTQCPRDRTGHGMHRSGCGIGMDFVAQQRRIVGGKIIEGRTGKAVTSFFEWHWFDLWPDQYFGRAGVADIETAPFLWRGKRRDGNSGKQDQREPPAVRPFAVACRRRLRAPRQRRDKITLARLRWEGDRLGHRYFLKLFQLRVARPDAYPYFAPAAPLPFGQYRKETLPPDNVKRLRNGALVMCASQVYRPSHVMGCPVKAGPKREAG